MYTQLIFIQRIKFLRKLPKNNKKKWETRKFSSIFSSILVFSATLKFYFFRLQSTGDEKLTSHIMTIDSMDRHKGGTYICSANNGVGQAASTQVNLHVLCE